MPGAGPGSKRIDQIVNLDKSQLKDALIAFGRPIDTSAPRPPYPFSLFSRPGGRVGVGWRDRPANYYLSAP